MMSGTRVAAEATPAPNQAREAALALQRLGFRILHIGPTISVEAPEALWESTFGVTFRPTTKSVLEGVPGATAQYPKADVDNMQIPADLQGLIADVAFVEPPDLF